MTRSRPGLYAGCAAPLSTFFLAACLFPSFDALSGPARPDDEDPSESEGKDGSTKSDANRPKPQSDGVTDPDADLGHDDGSTPLPKKIGCGSGGTCDPTIGSYCCFAFGAPSCKPSSEPPFCESEIHCDGNEDCATGQVCCLSDFVTPPAVSSCMSTCDGLIICDPNNPICPSPLTCQLEHNHDGTFKSFACQ